MHEIVIIATVGIAAYILFKKKDSTEIVVAPNKQEVLEGKVMGEVVKPSTANFTPPTILQKEEMVEHIYPVSRLRLLKQNEGIYYTHFYK